VKKVIIVVILLLLLFSFLFANEIKEENKKVTFWEVIGISMIGIFFIAIVLIASVIVNQGSSDSGDIKIQTGEKTDLELNPFPAEEEDKVTLKFLIKKITGNKITLQCTICKQGKILLTKVIGVEKGKKVNTQIKKLLNYPIDISVRCLKPGKEDQIRIDVERIAPITNTLSDTYSSSIWD
jgi:hypothetical protein